MFLKYQTTAFCFSLGNGPWFGHTEIPKGKECVSERNGGYLGEKYFIINNEIIQLSFAQSGEEDIISEGPHLY